MICASRSWDDMDAFEVVIGGFLALADRSNLPLKVHHFGGEQSVEHAIRHVCRRLVVNCQEHPADYTLGAGAASVRNLQLINTYPSLWAVVGFRGEGKAHEMDDLIVLAYDRNIPVYEIIGGHT